MPAPPSRGCPRAARAAMLVLSMAGAARAERMPTGDASPDASGTACGVAWTPPTRRDESWHTDRHGRVVLRAVRMSVTTATRERIEALLHYRYGSDGRLVAAGLPDGSELRYARAPDGSAIGLRRRPADTPFGGIEQALVRRVERIAGVRRLTYGDGTMRAVHREVAPPAPAPGVRHVLHDVDGRRLADLDARGRMTRVYVWLDDVPVAMIDFSRPRVPDAPSATLPERIGRAIAALWRWVAGDGERVHYLPSGRSPLPVAAPRPPPRSRGPGADSLTPPAPPRRRPSRRSRR